MKKRVEFEFNPARVMGWVATLIGITTAGYAMASWIDDAQEAHEKAKASPSPPYYVALEEEQTNTETTLELLDMAKQTLKEIYGEDDDVEVTDEEIGNALAEMIDELKAKYGDEWTKHIKEVSE